MPIVSDNPQEVFDLFHIALQSASDMTLTEFTDAESVKKRVSPREARAAFELIKAAPAGASISEWEHSPGEAAWMVMSLPKDGFSMSLSISSSATLATARQLSKSPQAVDPWVGIPAPAMEPRTIARGDLTEDDVLRAVESFPEATHVHGSFTDGMAGPLAEFWIQTRPGLPAARAHVFFFNSKTQEEMIQLLAPGLGDDVAELVLDHVSRALRGLGPDDNAQWNSPEEELIDEQVAESDEKEIKPRVSLWSRLVGTVKP